VLLNYLLAVLSGVLLVVIHPRLDLSLLAPFAIAPLVYALGREWVPKHRFLLGYVTGLVFWAGVNYWIHFVISVHGGLGTAGGTLGFLVFLLLRAIPMGLFALLAGVLAQKSYAIIGIPALWVAMERIPWLFYYTWLQLGNAGINMAFPMRLAPFTGVFGLSFLFAMLGTAMAWVALGRGRRELRWLAVLALLLLMPGLPGVGTPDREAVTVQPNIPERDDWTGEMARDTQKQMEYLTLRAAMAANAPKASIILWPEVPAPIYYFEDAAFRDRLNAMARMTKTDVMIGTVAQTPKGAPLNAALLVSPEGEPAGRYDKVFLVPFGEYVPWPFGLMMAKITSEIGDFETGTDVKVFHSTEQPVGAFICYESAFPQFVRQFTAAGARVLVNLSNDGYFGGAGAREQHLSLVRMRAVENQRWVLRSTNDGVTASINPRGEVVRTLPEYAVTSGRLPFAYRADMTFYVRYGDVFAWTCTGLGFLLLVLSQLPTYRRS
jgi:apolipoprotein N-acyltransferase